MLCDKIGATGFFTITMSENQWKEMSEMMQAPTKKQKIEKQVDDDNKENILPSEKNRSDFNFYSCSVTINYKWLNYELDLLSFNLHVNVLNLSTEWVVCGILQPH